MAGCTREQAPETPPTAPNGAPLGELSTPEELVKRADVPMYPGATAPEKRSNIKRDGEEARYEIILLTKDNPQQVFDFYKSKLPKGEVIGTQHMAMTPNGNFASITAEPEGSQTRITIVVRSTEKK